MDDTSLPGSPAFKDGGLHNGPDEKRYKDTLKDKCWLRKEAISAGFTTNRRTAMNLLIGQLLGAIRTEGKRIRGRSRKVFRKDEHFREVMEKLKEDSIKKSAKETLLRLLDPRFF